jgi:hypothetical protein
MRQPSFSLHGRLYVKCIPTVPTDVAGRIMNEMLVTMIQQALFEEASASSRSKHTLQTQFGSLAVRLAR